MLHELIHWTGHSKRLGRDLKSSDKAAYSYEELVAEMGSSYLCGLTGIAPKTLDNQSAYIAGWLKLAEGNRDIFIRASLDARKAVDYII